MSISTGHLDRLLDATARAERDHFWFRGFRRFVEPFVSAAAAGSAAPTILDCGCGTGNNLGLLRRHGRAVGIDLTLSGLRHGVSRGERAVAQASATALPFAPGTFDIVTSFDILYGLDDADEEAVLREMCRVLRPRGHLVINVAAMRMLKGNHSVMSRELRRYDRPMLRAALQRTGFEVRRMTYTNASIFPVVAGVRFAQRLAGLQPSQEEITVPPAPVNTALSAALTVEAAALRFVDMPFGSSILALAVKSAVGSRQSAVGSPSR